MGRSRGYWWAPDGSALVATPGRRRAGVPLVHRRPGPPRSATDRDRVPGGRDGQRRRQRCTSLTLDGERTEIWWDRDALPYLADVQWPERGSHRPHRAEPRPAPSPGARRQPGGRRHRRCSSRTSTTPGSSWCQGAPAVLDDGRIVMTADHEGARRLVMSSMPITPPDLQVRGILAVVGHTLLFSANPLDDPTNVGVWRFSDGATTEPLIVEPGVHTAWAGGKTVVARTASLEGERTRTWVLDGPELANLAEVALVRPNVSLLRAGDARAGHRRPAAGGSRRSQRRGDPARAARSLRRTARPAGPRDPFGVLQLAVVRRPGLRRGGGRRSRHARAGERVGARPCTATWPLPCSRTRWTPCTHAAERYPTWTCHGWPSAAGASVATWPRWP